MVPLLVLAAVGIGLQAYASWRAGQDQAAQAMENARRAGMAADLALQQGEQKAGMVELASSRRQGAQVAAYGHAGVDVTSGSPAKTVSATAMVGALDAAIVRNNAFREAWGYRLQGSSFQAAAQRAEDSSYWNLYGAIFGGAGRLASMAGPTPTVGGTGTVP